MKKSIVIHHWYRAAQWPEGELQIFATVTMDDGAGTVVSQAKDQRVNDPKLLKLLNDVDDQIIEILGGHDVVRHQPPHGLDRLPRHAQPGENKKKEDKVDGA